MVLFPKDEPAGRASGPGPVATESVSIENPGHKEGGEKMCWDHRLQRMGRAKEESSGGEKS